MPGGRPPKPQEVKEGMGNPGKRPMKTAPARVPGAPQMPSTFKGAAKTCWEHVTELLSRRGQLTLDSALSLAALCECYAEREKLRQHLDKTGHFQVVKTTAGDRVEKLRPSVAAYADADRRYRAWLTEFGLTDASRGKVQVDPARAPGAKPEAGKRRKLEAPADPAARYGLN